MGKGKTPFPENAPPIGSGMNDYNDGQQQQPQEDQSIGSAGMVEPQPYDRHPQNGPPIGSAGELNYHPGADPSIGTAGEIAPQPYQREFPQGPQIGSAGATPQAGWDHSVGTGNEGDKQKHGFLHNLFHRGD